MKYVSLNHFDDFEFHDAAFKFASYQSDTLVITAKHLNIHKDTKQNTNRFDMEIDSAIITFENFAVKSLEPIRAYQMDAKGNFYTDGPQIIYNGQDAKEIFITELKNTIWLNGLNICHENEMTMIEIETNSNAIFIAVCSCTDIKVEWNKYCDRAWYEKIEAKI